MKQVTQRLRDGRIEVLEVPAPGLTPEGVLVDVRASLLSTGTERNKVEAGRATLVGKARSRPDHVRQVIEKARRDGLRETLEAVRMRLDSPSPLGYSAAGIAIAVGERVRDIAPGDRVAIGGGTAVHAEIDHVPGNLCVRLPDAVSFTDGAFATVGAIALQGVRQADVRVGERAAVIGIGLVGRLTGQILRAAGCQVVGVDLSTAAVSAAVAAGDVDAGFAREELDGELSAQAGDCDAVIITAATGSSDPVELAARLCRDRGRVVVVGDVGMELPRASYYDKELELRLSRSYGPGRYDPEYEERGLDYPIGYVRWTERRNMAAFLGLIAPGRVDVAPLIGACFGIEEAQAAYERLLAGDSPLGIVITYGEGESQIPSPEPALAAAVTSPLSTAVIGAGSFAQRILIPSLRKAGFELRTVASASGLSARAAAERFGFDRAVEVDEGLADQDVGLVTIATRHASHASLASAALRAGKAVFVEKPPALGEPELEDLRAARVESGRYLAVGFNRRHAPLALRMREHLAATRMPVDLLYRVSAGPLAEDHWLNDLSEGGGRLLGEGCHFIDFACWLAGELPGRVECSMTGRPGEPLGAAQSFAATLEFPGGSLASILYSAAGASGLGKEYVEAHSGDRSAIVDDFRALELREGRRRKRLRTRSQDKGHGAQIESLRAVLEGRVEPDGPDPLDTMAATLAALRSACSGAPVEPQA